MVDAQKRQRFGTLAKFKESIFWLVYLVIYRHDRRPKIILGGGSNFHTIYLVLNETKQKKSVLFIAALLSAFDDINREVLLFKLSQYEM